MLLCEKACARAEMDIEHKDRRAVASAMQTFTRIWPYLTIVTLLVLLAITNYNKPMGSSVAGTSNHIVRNTLMVSFERIAFFPSAYLLQYQKPAVRCNRCL